MRRPSPDQRCSDAFVDLEYVVGDPNSHCKKTAASFKLAERGVRFTLVYNASVVVWFVRVVV